MLVIEIFFPTMSFYSIVLDPICVVLCRLSFFSQPGFFIFLNTRLLFRLVFFLLSYADMQCRFLSSNWCRLSFGFLYLLSYAVAFTVGIMLLMSFPMWFSVICCFYTFYRILLFSFIDIILLLSFPMMSFSFTCRFYTNNIF